MEFNEEMFRKIIREEQAFIVKELSLLRRGQKRHASEIASLKKLYHRQGILIEEGDARSRQILEIVSILASKVSAIEIRLETFDDHKERLSAVETAVRTHIADKKMHSTNL
jgi:hypothetical protein